MPGVGEASAAVLADWYRRDEQDDLYDAMWDEEFDPDCSPPLDEETRRAALAAPITSSPAPESLAAGFAHRDPGAPSPAGVASEYRRRAAIASPAAAAFATGYESRAAQDAIRTGSLGSGGTVLDCSQVAGRPWRNCKDAGARN